MGASCSNNALAAPDVSGVLLDIQTGKGISALASCSPQQLQQLPVLRAALKYCDEKIVNSIITQRRLGYSWLRHMMKELIKEAFETYQVEFTPLHSLIYSNPYDWSRDLNKELESKRGKKLKGCFIRGITSAMLQQKGVSIYEDNMTAWVDSWKVEQLWKLRKHRPKTHNVGKSLRAFFGIDFTPSRLQNVLKHCPASVTRRIHFYMLYRAGVFWCSNMSEVDETWIPRDDSVKLQDIMECIPKDEGDVFSMLVPEAVPCFARCINYAGSNANFLFQFFVKYAANYTVVEVIRNSIDSSQKSLLDVFHAIVKETQKIKKEEKDDNASSITSSSVRSTKPLLRRRKQKL